MGLLFLIKKHFDKDMLEITVNKGGSKISEAEISCYSKVISRKSLQECHWRSDNVIVLGVVEELLWKVQNQTFLKTTQKVLQTVKSTGNSAQPYHILISMT